MSGQGQVSFRNIVKMHGEFAALKGVNFEIKPGEFFALLGPSGSGKSTTLRILAGLDAPTSGRVLIDDKDVTSIDARDRDIAMVFQSYALYPHMTVAENIAFPLEMADCRRPRSARREEAARKVRIDHLLDRKPGPSLGWPAAALRARARHRAQSAAVPARRAPVQPRRQIAAGNPCRIEEAAALAGRHRRLCHP